MSGGSYGYLFSKFVEDLISQAQNDHSDLARMRDRLAEAEVGAVDAARETAELILIARQVYTRIRAIQDRLSGVWQAVEWMDSGDWNMKQVQAALRTYRGESE